MVSTSRWQRSTTSIRLRAAATSARDHVHVDAELARQHAARLADAAHAVERIADRQRMQHDAAGAHRMIAAGGERAGDVAVGDAGAGDIDVDRIEIRCAGRPDDTDSTTDSSCTDASRSARSTAWRTACFGLGEIDHGAGLHAARLGVADAENLDAVAAPPQHVLRALRLEPRDQADDLAGADVERRRRSPSGAATPASSSA